MFKPSSASRRGAAPSFPSVARIFLGSSGGDVGCGQHLDLPSYSLRRRCAAERPEASCDFPILQASVSTSVEASVVVAGAADESWN